MSRRVEVTLIFRDDHDDAVTDIFLEGGNEFQVVAGTYCQHHGQAVFVLKHHTPGDFSGDALCAIDGMKEIASGIFTSAGVGIPKELLSNEN